MNINEYIYFKPTASGENILLNYVYITESERTPDENGYHKLQFWVFCNLFGSSFTHGSNQYFIDNEVLFENPCIETNESA